MLRNKKIKNILVVILLFLAYAFILFTPLSNNFFRANDLSGDISSLVYIKEIFSSYNDFPQWIPYINQGLSLASDPLSSFLNPLVLFVFILLPTQFAVQFIIFLSIFLSGVSFYLLSKSLKISEFNSIVGSFLFMSSGYLVARLVAGHFELIISYPFIPLFYLFIMKLIGKKSYLNCFLISITCAMFLFSGANYLYYYSLIILSSLVFFEFINYLLDRNIRAIKNIMWMILTIFVTVLISAVKLIPLLSGNGLFVKDLMPFLGSQNPISFFFNLFLPFGIVYIKLGIGKYILEPYPWWESFSFVGIIPLVGIILFIIKFKKIKFDEKKYLVFIALIIILYLFLDNFWNPFYWMVKEISIMQKFRIPSRIYVYLIPLIFIFAALGFDKYIVKKISLKTFLLKLFIMTGIVFSLFSYFYIYEHRSMKPINQDFLKLIDYLRINDQRNDYYIAQNSLFENQLPQYKIIENNQKLLNSSYGYILNNSSTTNYINLDFYRLKKVNYTGIIPKYFIYPCLILPTSNFEYTLIEKNDSACLYKNKYYTPFAYVIGSNPKLIPSGNDRIENVSYLIGNDFIKVKFNSEKGGEYLKILESYYPGWNLKVDGVQENLIKDEYLVSKTKKGEHTYIFYFKSETFTIGLMITFLVLLISAFIIAKEKNGKRLKFK